MDGWTKRKEKQGFEPVIGRRRMGERGEDDRGKKGRVCVRERKSGGEVDSEMKKPFLTAW